MPDTAAHREWMAQNTTHITMRLNNRTDADILSALAGKPRQAEIKRLVRVALKVEKEEQNESR